MYHTITIITDEIADVLGVEQVSLCVIDTYVKYLKKNILLEHCLQFVPTYDLSWARLAD
jgi:hypothetical protein